MTRQTPTAAKLAEAQRQLDAYNEANGTKLRLERPEPLDLAACAENLDSFAARGDARSCRDIALAAIRECTRIRSEREHLRDELDAVGNVAYRASEAGAMDALEEIHRRAKRAAKGG